MYDLLLTQIDQRSFLTRAPIMAAKAFWASMGEPFSLRAVSDFAVAVARDYVASGHSDPVAIQVPFGNAIVVVILARDTPAKAIRVTQSFGGLYYKPAEKLLHFDHGGAVVTTYIAEAPWEKLPSFIDCSPAIGVANDGVSWTREYLETALVSRLIPREPYKKNRRTASTAVGLKERVTIGVPVYNSPHLFTKLINDLNGSLPDDPLLEICFVDDCGDSFSATTLREAVGKLRGNFQSTGVTISRNPENKGFITTCNELFAKARTDASIFVLLTTDIRLPPNWLDRVLEPFRRHKEVAIATPWAVNGANLAVENLPGFSWREMDEIAGQHAPRYLDAETTVGYCMAVRSEAMGANESLFSLVFENGYGDDSDLYYRMVMKGYRGVVVDNMVIYHQGGGSFNLLDNVEALRSDNFKTFSSIWMPIYQARIHAAAAKLNSLKSSRFVPGTPPECDILFVLPLDYRKAGGVEAVFKFVEGLQDRGINARIYSIRHHEDADTVQYEYRAVSAREMEGVGEVLRYFGRPSIVVATSHDTAPYVQALRQMLGCQAWHFVQGPEMAFSSGAFSSRVVRDLQKADRILCVSDYLAELISAVAQREADVIPYGPDPNEFYPLGKNSEKTIAVHFAGRADKGSDLAGIAVPILLNHGYAVEAFGEVSSYFEYDPRVVQHGFANAGKLRKLFQRCSHYLDLSRYEGLGLLGLEALSCGALPITMANGGTAEILERFDAGVVLRGIADLHRLPEIIEAAESIDVLAAAARVRASVGLQNAVDRFAAVLEDEQ
ncbi:glycosyltransferase [Rhizobium sp. TH2]|uniref:glycosyltransferase n=1 Tax=Rhizobium sp. TH2 TaxID=2775403 RepID=UPI0021571B3B|nr:glycosyltransferase [Rhizobium sp. TH2]UVC06994.1 glycosyltransferase [Rhizobium sp. TH2]